MPLRLSELLRNGRSHVQYDNDERTPSRPVTVGSHTFSPTRSSALRPPRPNRDETATLASLSYDNGTGRLDPQLIEDQGFPHQVKTTAQLADFIRSRSQDEPFPDSSSSRYSTDSQLPVIFPPRESSLPSKSFDLQSQISHHTAKMPFNPTVVGMRNRYGNVRPVVRILPGTQRKHQYEGYWLRRNTMRKEPVEVEEKSRIHWWSKKETVTQDSYVETSGWYDDDD